MNHHYAQGFKPSSKKKQKKSSSVTIGPDIIGSPNYTEYCVMKMREARANKNDESEEATQVIDLSGISSPTNEHQSQKVAKSDSNLFAFSSKEKAVEKKSSNRPVKGEWMTRRSSSSQSSSSSIVNSRWSLGKTAKSKVVNQETTKRKAVGDETTKMKVVEDDTIPITNLVYSDVDTNNKSSDSDSDDISFHPILADMNHHKGDRQTTLTQYVRSIETPDQKKNNVQTTKNVQMTLSQFVTPMKTPSDKKKV